jgi:hypothetical protein
VESQTRTSDDQTSSKLEIDVNPLILSAHGPIAADPLVVVAKGNGTCVRA